METVLCDELIQEIFQKLPPNSSSSVSLVSKRWLYLYRTSITSLSLRTSLLRLNPHSLSTLLSHYPSLSSLSLLLPPETAFDPGVTSDHLLLLASSLCPRLVRLSLLGGATVSLSSLVSLSRTSTNLTALCINLSRPLVLHWLLNFPSLRELSLFASESQGLEVNRVDRNDDSAPEELGIERLCLSGIRNDDCGLDWLWKSCNMLKKLELSNCSGVGYGGSFSSLTKCLKGIQEVELRTCRTIVDGILMKLSENCDSLESLLVHDGGSREGLLRFFSQCRFPLRRLNLRLPLDLDNEHLLAASASFGASLSSIRLQSCCLLSGEGLKALAVAASAGLEELALINCNIVERESGLLTTLGQSLKRLRKLDLSYNETLVDKEFVSMLASCRGLVDLKLRSCKKLTGSAMVSMSKSCKDLENVDVMNCRGIKPEAVELFVMNSPSLRRVQVEESKLSDAAKNWASTKFIEVIDSLIH